VVFQFRSYGQDIRTIGDFDNPELFIFAVLFAIIPLTLHAVNWGAILQNFGNRIRFRDVLFIYFYSSLVRYLPGTYWYILTRTTMGVKEGHTPENLLLTTGLELVVKVISGIFVLVLAFICGLSLQLEQLAWIGVWLVLGVGLYLYLHLTRKGSENTKTRNVWLDTLKKPIHLLQTRPLILGKWALIYLLAWVIQGFVLWLIIKIWQPLNLSVIIWTIFAYTSGWIAGFLNPFAPNGLGAREAVFMAILAPIVPVPIILGASLLMRLNILICELILTMVGWISRIDYPD